MENLYISCKKTFNTPAEFLENLFIDDYIKVDTFYDKECTQLQCNAKRRSFDDLYILFKTYFNDITKKELLILLLEKVTFYFCNRIRKIVFHRVNYEFIKNFAYDSNFNELVNMKISDQYNYEDNTHTASDLLEILEVN